MKMELSRRIVFLKIGKDHHLIDTSMDMVQFLDNTPTDILDKSAGTLLEIDPKNADIYVPDGVRMPEPLTAMGWIEEIGQVSH